VEETYEAHELLERLGVGGDEVGERDGHGDVDAELGDLQNPLGRPQRRHAPPATATHDPLPPFFPLLYSTPRRPPGLTLNSKPLPLSVSPPRRRRRRPAGLNRPGLV
jgi:hypothetical protein